MPALAMLVVVAVGLAILGGRLLDGSEQRRTLPADPPLETAGPYDLALEFVFPTRTISAEIFRGNFWASPAMVSLPGEEPALLVFPSVGEVVALEPESGTRKWGVKLPRQRQQNAQLLAAPVQVGDQLVVAYTLIHQGTGNWSHHLAVVDLAWGEVNPDFSVLEIAAQVPAAEGEGVVRFDPATHQPRSALTHIPAEGGLGLVYVPFGSIRDQGAWHGWLFEIDLDAWKAGPPGNAVSAVFVTTPEADCDDGTNDKLCAGGIWAYSGPQIHRSATGYEIVVQTGNGKLDLRRGSYSQSLIRLRPGLQFAPECNPVMCAEDDPREPSDRCLRSCKNLFVPRLLPQDAPLRPADGSCDSKSYLECLDFNDWDFGSSAPLRVALENGSAVYVTAGKAGDVFLLDAEILGIMYDRKQAVGLCGTADHPCPAINEGLMITQPQAGWIDGQPIVVFATFNPDQVHAAGVVAYAIDLDGADPRLREVWRVPDPASAEARRWFRAPPTRPIIGEFEGEQIVWVADNAAEGRVLGIRLRDGHVMANHRTAGWPMRNAKPVLYEGVLYLPTAFPKREDLTWIEAYRIRRSAR
ncbi:MAG: hypothetical protein L0210_12465 [Rhodospirillales bacterium]|nr:hypothetical protein [Rhodospirillales bacterium]